MRSSADAHPARAIDATYLLYLTPILWGATFPAAKLAIDPLGPLPPLTFMAWSRGLGFVTLALAIAVAAARAHQPLHLSRTLLPGAIVGLFIFLGYVLQTLGLRLTTATNAGFITGLYVVFTPLLGLALFRQAAGRAAWIAAAVSVVGLALMSIHSLETIRPRAGDLLVLASAVAWAAQVVALGRFARRYPARTLALVQMGAAAAFHALAASTTGARVADAASVWGLLIVTGILGSGVAFTLQVIAQKAIDAARAVIVLAGESVAAAVFAAFWIDERLLLHQWIGALLILGAMTMSELGARRRPDPSLTPS